jgi:acyl-CoA dehydrogenase
MLFNPTRHNRYYPDHRSTEIMHKTIAFFEHKGKHKLKQDDHHQVWYSDFLEFQKQEQIFATLLSPPAYGRY